MQGGTRSTPYHPYRPNDPMTLDPHPHNAALREQGADVYADAIVDLRGDADVGHGELADDRARGGSEKSRLGQGQRQGRVGTDAGLIGIPRPGVETRREIDGEDRRGMGIGRGDETRGRSRGRAVETKTEQRIDDQVGVGEIARALLGPVPEAGGSADRGSAAIGVGGRRRLARWLLHG